MKKRIFTILIGLMMLFTLNSCVVGTYATTQDDIYVETEVDVVRSNVSFDVIIQYGTPYYRDGVLLYYLYRDIYYYPFYYNNYWYVRAYRKPFTHFDHRPYFRPHKYDYRFSPGHYRGFDRPRDPNVHHRNVAPNTHHRPNGNYRRPQGNRPDIQPRQNRPDRQVRPTQPQTRPQAHPQTPPRGRIDSGQQRQNTSGRFGGRR